MLPRCTGGIRLGIQFEIAVVGNRTPHHALYIDSRSWPLIDQPPSWMGKDVQITIIHGAQETLGLFP